MVLKTGTNATDDLLGTAAADELHGSGGDDRLQGFDGIDWLFGEAGDDSLYGGNGNDRLKGGSGYDFLSGGKGNDLLDGGSALDSFSPSSWTEIDTVGYLDEKGGSGVAVNLATGTATDSFGNTDTLVDIERVTGTGFADSLIGGNAGNDSFEGFIGYGGADTINGGRGFDVADYYWDNSQGGYFGIVVNLTAGTVRDGFGTVDSVSGIEQISGTGYSDDFKGSSSGDEFMPFGGNDVIDGRLGSDTVSYATDVWRNGKTGVHANLDSGVIIDTQGYADTVVSIENVIGSAWDDSILGNDAGNLLGGHDGADVIKGRAGDDEIYGDDGMDALYGGTGSDYISGWSGIDRMRGGDGADVFGFYRNSDTDIILDFKTGTDKLDVHDYGFATAADVLALIKVVSADTAILDFGDDRYIELHNIKTGATFLAAGDIII
jgi:Ca2+-binding RTX toxin-like protein